MAHEGDLASAMFSFLLLNPSFRAVPGCLDSQGRKRPAHGIRHWKEESRSADCGLNDLIKWRECGALAMMLACEPSGLVVIDCDTNKETGEPTGDNEFWRRFDGKIDPRSLFCVRTPHGGHHYYFKSKEAYTSTASRIAPSVDVRSRGGLIVAPYSQFPTGAYVPLDMRAVKDGRGIAEQLAVLPPLLDFERAPAPDPDAAAALFNVPVLAEDVKTELQAYEDKRCAAAVVYRRPMCYSPLQASARNRGRMEKILDKIRRASQGERNPTLSRQTWAALHCAVENGMNVQDACARIADAASSTGLPTIEIRNTINSALRKMGLGSFR